MENEEDKDRHHESELNSNMPYQSETSSISSKSSTKFQKWSTKVWKLILEEWFLIALGSLILTASQAQVPKSHQKLKQTVVSYTCVSIIFFLTGCTLKTKTLLDNYSRWKLHLFVQIQCYLMTSAVIFGIVSACATNTHFMDAGLLLGFILGGCTATTISSNVVMTKDAHGNQALTVVQSTLGNFLGPFLTPALFSMYTSTGAWYTLVLPKEQGGYGEVYRRVFQQLGLSLFLPMVVGQLVQNLLPKFTQKVIIGWKLFKLSSLALLVIVWQTYDSAFSSGAFTSVKGTNIVFIVFVSIALFGLFSGIAFLTSMIWLPKADTISVCYCAPAKSVAILVPVSLTLFKGIDPVLLAKIQIPIVIYQGLQIVGGAVLIHPFRSWIDRDSVSSASNDLEADNRREDRS